MLSCSRAATTCLTALRPENRDRQERAVWLCARTDLAAVGVFRQREDADHDNPDVVGVKFTNSDVPGVLAMAIASHQAIDAPIVLFER